MQTTSEIEAAQARKADAEVSFKFAPFFEETLVNLFGTFSAPYVLWAHGRVGMRNRLLGRCDYSALFSVFWPIVFFLINIFHGIYWGTEGYVVSTYEIVLIDLIVVLRCMTIGAKYSYFSTAELLEMDLVPQPFERLSEKYVLVGWVAPSPRLLFKELERAMTRTAPHMCTHKLLYGDQTSRDAMLWSLKKCVPSFLRFELGIDLEKELMAESQAKADAAAAEAKAKAAAAAAAAWGGAPSSATTAASSGNNNNGTSGAPGDAADMSLEAQAVRKLIGWLDSGAAGFCDYGLEEAMQKAMAAAMDAALSQAIGSSAGATGGSGGGKDKRGRRASAAAAAAAAHSAPGASEDEAGDTSFLKKAGGNFVSPPRDDTANALALAAAAGAGQTSVAAAATSAVAAAVDAVNAQAGALPPASRPPPPAPPRPQVSTAAAPAAAAAASPFEAMLAMSPMQRMDARMRAGLEVQRRAAEVERAAAAAGARRDALGSDDAFHPSAGGKMSAVVALGSNVAQRLPFIPAKLFAWHCLYTAFITNNPSFGPSLWLTFMAGWIFGFLPVIARAIAGSNQPFGCMWASYAVSIMWIITAYQNFQLTARYVAVAPLDFIRRLNIMQLLSTVIDPMSPIATEFSIPQAPGTAALAAAASSMKASGKHASEGKRERSTTGSGAAASSGGAGGGSGDPTARPGSAAAAAASTAGASGSAGRPTSTRVRRINSHASPSPAPSDGTRDSNDGDDDGDDASSSMTDPEEMLETAEAGGLVRGANGAMWQCENGVCVRLMPSYSMPMSAVAQERLAELETGTRAGGRGGAAAAAASSSVAAHIAAAGRGSAVASGVIAPPQGGAGWRGSGANAGAGGGSGVWRGRASSTVSGSAAAAGRASASTGGAPLTGGGGLSLGPRLDGGARVTVVDLDGPAGPGAGAAGGSTSNARRASVVGGSAPPAPAGRRGSILDSISSAIASAGRRASVAGAGSDAEAIMAATEAPGGGRRGSVTTTAGGFFKSLVAPVGILLAGPSSSLARESSSASVGPRSSISVAAGGSAADATAVSLASSAAVRASRASGRSSVHIGTSAAAAAAGIAPVATVVPSDLGAVLRAGTRGGRIEGFLEKRALRNNRGGDAAAATGKARSRLSLFSGLGGGWRKRYFACEADTGMLAYGPSPSAPAIHSVRITARSVIARYEGRPHAFMLILDASRGTPFDSPSGAAAAAAGGAGGSGAKGKGKDARGTKAKAGGKGAGGGDSDDGPADGPSEVLYASASDEDTLRAWMAFIAGIITQRLTEEESRAEADAATAAAAAAAVAARAAAAAGGATGSETASHFDVPDAHAIAIAPLLPLERAASTGSSGGVGGGDPMPATPLPGPASSLPLELPPASASASDAAVHTANPLAADSGRDRTASTAAGLVATGIDSDDEELDVAAVADEAAAAIAGERAPGSANAAGAPADLDDGPSSATASANAAGAAGAASLTSPRRSSTATAAAAAAAAAMVPAADSAAATTTDSVQASGASAASAPEQPLAESVTASSSTEAGAAASAASAASEATTSASAASASTEAPAKPTDAGSSRASPSPSPAPSDSERRDGTSTPAEAAKAAGSSGLRRRRARAAAAVAAAAAESAGDRTTRSSILARQRLLALTQDAAASAGADRTFSERTAMVYMPVLYGENLVSWMAVRQVCLDFGDSFKMRISVYTCFFAVLVIATVLLLLFQFGDAGRSVSEQAVMIATAAFGQAVFAILLALSIVQGARLNDAAVMHRFRLSRVETLIIDLLVAAETPGLASARRLRNAGWRHVTDDSPVQRQLRLTRQVCTSLAQALVVETAILPARVLFMPASFALLSTFGSISLSGILSAAKTLAPKA